MIARLSNTGTCRLDPSPFTRAHPPHSQHHQNQCRPAPGSFLGLSQRTTPTPWRHLPTTHSRPSRQLFLLAYNRAEQPLDLYVVGGYLGKSCSAELSDSLFSALHGTRRTFRVVLACVGRLNSMSVRGGEDGKSHVPGAGAQNLPSAAGARSAAAEAETHRVGSADAGHGEWFPRQTGLAIDLASGQAYPVRFEGAGRGPGWEVRSSRIFAGSREEALTEVGCHE